MEVCCTQNVKESGPGKVSQMHTAVVKSAGSPLADTYPYNAGIGGKLGERKEFCVSRRERTERR